VLRESYGRTLHRFLNLKTAIVQSGLSGVSQAPGVAWQAIVEPASQITVIARDPSQWLVPNLPHLLRAAEKRGAAIVIGLPDPAGACIAEIAATVGLTNSQILSQNIELAVSTVENQWTTRKTQLHSGSSIRVVSYDDVPLYELLVADEVAVCLLRRPCTFRG
jgi:hypothetical protein